MLKKWLVVAEERTNQSLATGGIDHLIHIKKPVRTDWKEPGTPTKDLGALLQSSEPWAQKIRGLRESEHADLVVLLTSSPAGASGYAGGPKKSLSPDKAYAVVTAEALQGRDTFTHELRPFVRSRARQFSRTQPA